MVQTPVFMPVGTAGTVKAMTADQVRATGAGLVLGNSLDGGAAEHLSVSSNGAFVFQTRATTGQSYAVTVLTSPSGPAQSCTVSAGSGTAGSADITNVQVSCPPFFVFQGSIDSIET